MTVARTLVVALVLLLAFPAGNAVAQQPLLPPETLAQEQTQPPETVPTDEDDEELGEEIPEEQEQTPEPQPDPPRRATPDPPPERPRAIPRTGSNPLPFLALAAILISSGFSIRSAVDRS